VVKPQVFDGTSSKVLGFVIAYRLYVKMRLREVVLEEQIQWILSYIQGRLVDIWKENVSVGEFLAEIKKEFERRDKESIKVAKLKKIEQGERTMKEFVQDFKRVSRGSGYEGCPLIEEFKRWMNTTIKRRLIEVEN